MLQASGAARRHAAPSSSPGERVLLKPNLLYGKAPEFAVTTHPEVLRGVIELVRKAGAYRLVGDSPGSVTFRKVAEKSGCSG